MDFAIDTPLKVAATGVCRRLAACAIALACWAGAMCASPCGAADLRMDAGNKGVVELETDSPAGISVRIAEDLAGLVDDGATRRVLPVVGQTSRQNLSDLLMLRGIDMAILQTDVLDSLHQQHSLPGLESSFSYVTKLYNEEFHLLATAGVKTVGDLVHRRVSIGTAGSGTSVTAERLFALLGISIEPVNDRPEVALGKLRRGDITAMAFVAGKPASLFQGVPADGVLHFVPVPMNPGIINAYVPTALDAGDYPGLIPKDQPVDTIAVGSLLAVAKLAPGSERYRNVSNFVDIFFTQFRTLLNPGHHPKWHDINLAAELPGWTRFPPAQQWLDRNTALAQRNRQDMKTLFSRFLDSRQQVLGGSAITEHDKQDLFNAFQSWQSGQVR